MCVCVCVCVTQIFGSVKRFVLKFTSQTVKIAVYIRLSAMRRFMFKYPLRLQSYVFSLKPPNIQAEKMKRQAKNPSSPRCMDSC